MSLFVLCAFFVVNPIRRVVFSRTRKARPHVTHATYLTHVTLCLLTLAVSSHALLAKESAPGSGGASKAGVCFKQVLRPTGPGNPRNGEGDIIPLKDGRLLLVYSHWVAAGGDDAPADIRACHSTDGGQTWGPDSVLIPNDAMNLMSVSLLRLHNGELMLAYGRRYSNARLWMYARFSRDEGNTWTGDSLITPVPGYQGVNNARIIQLRSGRLLAPAFFCRGETWMQDYFFYALAYYSDDNGRTWKTTGQKLAIEGCKNGADEPGVVELKDGRVLMLLRSNLGRIYQSFSSDRGLAWSKPEPTSFNSPDSPATITRIPTTGDLLLIWNNVSRLPDGTLPTPNNRGCDRSPLSSAVSSDEGKTWKHIKNLEEAPDGCYCYTSVTFSGTRAILSYYERGSLKLLSADVKWFYE